MTNQNDDPDAMIPPGASVFTYLATSEPVIGVPITAAGLLEKIKTLRNEMVNRPVPSDLVGDAPLPPFQLGMDHGRLHAHRGSSFSVFSMLERSGPLGTFNGLRIVCDSGLTRYVPYPRSRGRSIRRAKLGHKQHYAHRPSRDAFRFGDALFIHPEMIAALRAGRVITAQEPPT